MKNDTCKLETISIEPFRRRGKFGTNYYREEIYAIGDEKFKVDLKYEKDYHGKEKGGVYLHKWNDDNGWNHIHLLWEDNAWKKDLCHTNPPKRESFFTPYINQMKEMSKKFAAACYPL